MGSLGEGFPGKKETVCQSTECTQIDQHTWLHTQADTCRTDDCQGPKDGLVCVISLACFEVYSQLDFKPVLLLFFSPVVAFFSAQIPLQWPCVCLTDVHSVLSSGASLKCDLYIVSVGLS